MGSVVHPYLSEGQKLKGDGPTGSICVLIGLRGPILLSEPIDIHTHLWLTLMTENQKLSKEGHVHAVFDGPLGSRRPREPHKGGTQVYTLLARGHRLQARAMPSFLLVILWILPL